MSTSMSALISPSASGIVRPPNFVARGLLALIRERPRTRSELMMQTGRTRATVVRDLAPLVDMGLVKTAGTLAQGGGRPAELLRFNASAGLVGASVIGAEHAHIAVADLDGTVLAQCTEDLEGDSEPEGTAQRLVRCWERLLAGEGRPRGSVSAIAVGVPWIVDPSGKRVVDAPRAPGWREFHLADAVAAEYHRVPVVIERDANLMVIGERLQRYSNERDLVFVKLDATIAVGMLIGGRLARGATGLAGDVGHINVPGNDDLPCTCGERGCLEAVASGEALARRLRELGADLKHSGHLAAYLASPSHEAMHVVRHAGQAIGSVLSTIVNTVNPSSVVLGGSVADVGAPLLAAVRTEIYRQSRTAATQDLRVAASPAWEQAAIAGAARMAVDELFAPDPLSAQVAP